MPGDFYSMLGPTGINARAVGRRPFGMPDIDSGDNFMHEAFSYANEMKNRDALRQQEMMHLQNQMRMQAEGRARQQAMIERGRQLNPANKNYVLGAGSGSGKLPPSTVEADNAARDAKAAQINQAFAAEQALREEKAATRTSAEKIAGINAQSKADIANDKGWSFINRQDPTDPTKIQTFRANNATGQVEPVNYGDENIGGAAKLGTKLPVLNQGVNPEQLKAFRDDARAALDELNQLRDPETRKMRPHMATASGGTGMFGLTKYIPGDPFGAAEAEGGLNSLKAKLTLALIQKLKAASKTGATGFGALNLKELATLENSVTKVKTGWGGLSDEANEAELNRIGDRLEMILQDPEAAANTSGPQGTAPAGRSSQNPVNPVKTAPKKDIIWKNPKNNRYEKKQDIDQILADHGM